MKLNAERTTRSKTTRARGWESDLNYAVQVSRFILRMIGVWPTSRFASNAERLVTVLLNVVCYLLLVFIMVPSLLLIFLKERDLRRRVRLVGPLLNCVIGCAKYGLLVCNANGVRICLEQMQRDWQDTVDPNDRQAMLSSARTGRNFAIFSATVTYIAGLSHRTIMPLSKGRMLTPMNTTVRALACPSYFVKFDEQASPAYEIIFVLQFFAGVVTYTLSCGAAGLAALFVTHVCGRLNILIGKLQRLNDILEPEDRVVATLLADIVQHQIAVKSFLKQVEETLRCLWLVEIVGSTMLLCFAGYYIIMDWENSDSTGTLTMCVMSASFTFSLFTMCYVGQLLTDQSIKVGLKTSTMNWHRLPHKRARSLILIIAISNVPAKISAGRIIEMSLPTFGSIIRTSMAYFNLLRKFV